MESAIMFRYLRVYALVEVFLGVLLISKIRKDLFHPAIGHALKDDVQTKDATIPETGLDRRYGAR